jgi:hypothetical protein
VIEIVNVLALAILLPVVLYASARVVSVAYFKTKREHTNALLHDIDPHTTGDEDGKRR